MSSRSMALEPIKSHSDHPQRLPASLRFYRKFHNLQKLNSSPSSHLKKTREILNRIGRVTSSTRKAYIGFRCGQELLHSKRNSDVELGVNTMIAILAREMGNISPLLKHLAIISLAYHYELQGSRETAKTLFEVAEQFFQDHKHHHHLAEHHTSRMTTLGRQGHHELSWRHALAAYDQARKAVTAAPLGRRGLFIRNCVRTARNWKVRWPIHNRAKALDKGGTSTRVKLLDFCAKSDLHEFGENSPQYLDSVFRYHLSRCAHGQFKRTGVLCREYTSRLALMELYSKDTVPLPRSEIRRMYLHGLALSTCYYFLDSRRGAAVEELKKMASLLPRHELIEVFLSVTKSLHAEYLRSPVVIAIMHENIPIRLNEIMGDVYNTGEDRQLLPVVFLPD